MKIIALSSLEKVFHDEAPSAPEYKSFSMLKNERSSFQAAFCPEGGGKVTVTLGGDLAAATKAYIVREVPVGLPCFENADDLYLRKTPGDYPDVLESADGGFKAEGGNWYSVWVEVSPNGGYIGSSELTVGVECGEESGEESVTVEVIDAELPEQSIICTEWYHSDCICNYYGIEPFSDEYWRINENFMRTAATHGMNCILTPLFTPPLDTKVGGERRTVQLVKVRRAGGKYYFDFTNLKKWIDLAQRCGIRYFEMSHFFTQWGAKHAPKIVAIDRKGREKKIFGWSTRTSSKAYDDFLRQFGSALVRFIDDNGIRERCFFHISDEPSLAHLKIYKQRAKLISEIFPGFTVIDALSNLEFYETGAVKQPIPCENEADKFFGKVPELWTYYCCGQGSEYMPNRFMSMPSLRNRVLGIIMYKYDVKGFLQWGYNFYNTQYSIKNIDPYKVTDAGGAFPSGDSFVVYPGKGGEAVPSLRLKVFYDAFQDAAALRLLESKLGREKVLEFIDKDLFKPLTFREYPHENDWLLETREKINQMIKEN